ncbi:hypothetical protein RB595_002877 [Gaeumannomyces hyphopodioides]
MPLHDDDVGTFEMDATGWLLPRATEVLRPENLTAVVNKTTALLQLQRNATSPQMLINEFRFAAAKSIRTSTIILATLNTIAAFATVLGILWENYSRERRTRGYSIRRDGLNFVSAPEVYPLFVSVAITIQGIVLAAAQGAGLESLFATGCALIAQAMLPALFLVPAVQIIFGLETYFRAIRSRPFLKRGPWAVRLCLVGVAVASLASFLWAYVDRSPPFCFASQFWFIANYSLGCFVILLIVSAILTLSVITIFMKLKSSPVVGPTERVDASRMVYYLVLAIISNVLLLPFFYHMAFIDQRDPRFQGLTLSVVASVVTEVSGVLTGGLHLFLRSSTMTAIAPREKIDDEHQKLKTQIRRGRPDDDVSDYGITSPNGLRRMESESSMISRYEKDIEASSPYDTKEDDALYPQPPKPSHLPAYSAVRPESRTRTKSVSSVLSVFRPKSTRQSNTLLPATTYSPGGSATGGTAVKPHRFDFSTLKPPPSMRTMGVGRHRRDSSIASHITVQLGLRLSNLDNIPPMGPRQSCDTSSPCGDDGPCMSTIPLVNQTGMGMGSSSAGPPSAQAQRQQQQLMPTPKLVPKPSPLARAVYVPPTVESDIDSDKFSLDDDAVMTSSRTPTRAQRSPAPPVVGEPKRSPVMVTIPAPAASPRPQAQPVSAIQQEESSAPLLTLSPTIYSPNGGGAQSKLVSPKGVGFTSPVSRYNSSGQRSLRSQPSQGTLRSATGSQRSVRGGAAAVTTAPPPRKASVATLTQPPPAAKSSSGKGGDWI